MWLADEQWQKYSLRARVVGKIYFCMLLCCGKEYLALWMEKWEWLAAGPKTIYFFLSGSLPFFSCMLLWLQYLKAKTWLMWFGYDYFLQCGFTFLLCYAGMELYLCCAWMEMYFTRQSSCLFERAIQNRRRFAGRNGKWEIRRGWDTFLRENSLLQMTPHSILSHFPSCWIWRLKVNVLTCLGLGFCRGESVDAEKFRLISHVPQIHPPLLPNFLY